ncbi:bacteriohemerythrin [Desulfopila aestuarii]|uniref:HAMP domain-containing protein n=1 Tax=Desulfopila aestuarii DSM 18488 TaxID=1121416 RepID=A0A1M7Y9Q6_9BACT|nr:bacteriohemerythrin [Desulfopila aestuarii]SHO49268.1 HAMP domain-containing protein [Desulfopila aestuarii DSM 18488]
MIEYCKQRLSIKVLMVLVAILVVSFAALGLSVISKQGDLLTEMRTGVREKLQKTGKDAESLFASLEGSVDEQLTAMGKETADSLSTATSVVLSAEEENIRQGMNNLLVSNAKAVVSVLGKVAEDAIMAKEYDQLVDFSRSVAKTEEIVYVFFLDQNDTLLPGYINVVDDLILSYLEKSGLSDEEDQLLQMKGILDESKKDSSVMLYEQVVEYYSLPIGKIVICISKAGVAKEIEALSARFETLKKNNETSIQKVIGDESAAVVAKVKSDLAGVASKNSQAIEETGAILATSAQAVRSGVTWAVLLVGTICCLGVIFAMAVMLRLMVIRPILGVTAGLHDTAEGEGDLTKRLNVQRSDEIGVLAKWFDVFVAKLNDIIVDIGANAETVTSSSMEVLSASDQMLEESDELKSKANGVAVASEEMTVSMNSVAAACEQAATNIGFVAQAAEEMRLALDSVVMECNRAQGVTSSASSQVQSAATRVSELGEAAREISNVSQVITDIADQTNLLALNATIEAARAGEAGKGFAVVASEIKALANQTQEATQQIKARIESIQTSTNDTVKEVGLITTVITDVETIMGTIAVSMTEQSERAAEVAQNIEQASLGIGEVNENVAQSSQVSAQIAGDIADVSAVAQDMANRSHHMRESSESLSELAGQLRKMISVFKVSMSDSKRKEMAGSKTDKVVPDVFVWNNRLVTGLSDIDEQHKKLVQLINALHRAMKSRLGAEESGRILAELTDYTVYHFGFEEKMFAKYSYPATAEHKKAHKNLVDKVMAFQRDFQEGKAGLSVELMDFLCDWLREHIMKTDMSYVSHFKEKGVK